MKPARVASVVVVAAVVLVAGLPEAAAAQSSGGAAPNPAPLRGEWIRLPDARADVSVVAPDPDAVPTSLWARLDGGAVPILSRGSAALEARVRERLEAGGARVTDVGRAEDIGDAGVEITSDDQVRLVWRALSEAVAIDLVAEARAAVEAFELTVHIPHSGVVGDMWGLQAELSRAGIRRVRFVAGS